MKITAICVGCLLTTRILAQQTYSGLVYENPATSLHPARGADIGLSAGVTDIEFSQSAGTLSLEYHIPGTYQESFDLWVNTPQGTSFAPGSYIDANLSIFPQAGRPSMLFAYEGSTYNTGIGEFDILELTWTGDTLTSAAIDFGERSTDTNPNDLTYGSFRYNSPIPFTSLVPEPSMFGLAALGGAVSLMVRRKR